MTPDFILQIGMGVWPTKTLLSAVELGFAYLTGERECSLSRRSTCILGQATASSTRSISTLQIGKPQNEIKRSGTSMSDALYDDEARLDQFMDAISGVLMDNSERLTRRLDFSSYYDLEDIGGTAEQLPCFMATDRPRMGPGPVSTVRRRSSEHKPHLAQSVACNPHHRLL
jgi:hypothetical protein